MAEQTNLESELQEIDETALAPKGSKLYLSIEKNSGKFLSFIKNYPVVRIYATDIKDDIEFAANLQRELRDKFGRGVFSNAYDARTEKFEATYEPIKGFSPAKIMKTVSISGTSRVIHEYVRPSRVYETPGTN